MHSFVPALDTPTYSINDVAAAAGISTAKVKKMLDDGVISLGPYDQEATQGVPGLFTLRRVISIGLAAESVALGMSPSMAARLAFMFTDGSPRDRAWLGLPQSCFIILFFEKDEYKISPNLTLSNAQILPSGGRAVAFGLIEPEDMVQRFKDRLAKRKARRRRTRRDDRTGNLAGRRTNRRLS
jgi:hypothetical protein